MVVYLALALGVVGSCIVCIDRIRACEQAENRGDLFGLDIVEKIVINWFCLAPFYRL